MKLRILTYKIAPFTLWHVRFLNLICQIRAEECRILYSDEASFGDLLKAIWICRLPVHSSLDDFQPRGRFNRIRFLWIGCLMRFPRVFNRELERFYTYVNAYSHCGIPLPTPGAITVTHEEACGLVEELGKLGISERDAWAMSPAEAMAVVFDKQEAAA